MGQRNHAIDQLPVSRPLRHELIKERQLGRIMLDLAVAGLHLLDHIVQLADLLLRRAQVSARRRDQRIALERAVVRNIIVKVAQDAVALQPAAADLR